MLTAGMHAVRQAKLDQTRFLSVMKQLGSAEFESAEIKQHMDDEHEIDRNVTKTMIRSAFVALIYIAGLWSLFVDLNS